MTFVNALNKPMFSSMWSGAYYYLVIISDPNLNLLLSPKMSK